MASPGRIRLPLTAIPGVYAEWLAPRLGVNVNELTRTGDGKDVLGRSVWFETPLDAEWMAAYRLTPQDGHIVVSELRVFPIEPNRDRGNAVGAGLWSGELLGNKAPVPPGGLSARLVRKVRVGEHTSHAGLLFDWFRRNPITGALLEDLGGFDETATFRAAGRKPEAPTRERRGHPPLLYARLADTYGRAIARGDRQPVEAVARRHQLRVVTARALIHKARLRGFLTMTIKGRSAGAPTPKAQAILAAARKPKPRKTPTNRTPRRKAR